MNRGRGSTRRWRRFRARVLHVEPLCRRCAAQGYTVAADTLHHQVPVHVDPTREFDRDNCEPLCDACHDAEHAAAPAPAGQSGFDARVAELEGP